MNKVGAVLIALVAIPFGCWGLYVVVASMGPDGGGWGGFLRGLLLGLFFLFASIVCLWGALRMWIGEEK